MMFEMLGADNTVCSGLFVLKKGGGPGQLCGCMVSVYGGNKNKTINMEVF